MIEVVTRYCVAIILCWTRILERRENVANPDQRWMGIVWVCSVGLRFIRRSAKVDAIGDLTSSSLKLG